MESWLERSLERSLDDVYVAVVEMIIGHLGGVMATLGPRYIQ